LSKHIKDQDPTSIGRFMFSKTIINLDMFEHNSIRELFDYVDNKDVELKEVKFLIRKANMKLKTNGKQLFIKRSSDKEVGNIICVTRM
jgi:hypothetical protein